MYCGFFYSQSQAAGVFLRNFVPFLKLVACSLYLIGGCIHIQRTPSVFSAFGRIAAAVL